ncbi:DUF4245 domain-containing protein [Planosporangium flavigriseum]|uniref:DUF4245 domain-containing protein n=1 Tax=Planosporangium flavigriseum TaxID=373681 RepID=A0A8J3PLR5_9ACTN|nr:DUF4245 domain-containing protein [Planosporangium flavigriseum]NJC63450.1 DUF4245 domain-containing protein [Planosporangium flavigriseum]GIG72146.1 hypothetical protein Pfl04_05500 [Planosporangium flavigriseum]
MGRSPRDMALSLLVLLVPIIVLLGVYRFLGGESPTVVDPSSAYADARAASAFPVAEPAVPTGWQPVSSVFRRSDAGAVLRVGFRSPRGGTAQLVESNVPAGALVKAELSTDARDEGRAQVNGQEWRRYAASNGDRALVLSQPDRTVIVMGRASDAELSQLAASLH